MTRKSGVDYLNADFMLIDIPPEHEAAAARVVARHAGADELETMLAMLGVEA